MPLPADWDIMTDRERSAWKAKNEPAPKPATPSKTPEQQVEEQRQRKGGYIRSDSWYQTTDEHQ